MLMMSQMCSSSWADGVHQTETSKFVWLVWQICGTFKWSEESTLFRILKCFYTWFSSENATGSKKTNISINTDNWTYMFDQSLDLLSISDQYKAFYKIYYNFWFCVCGLNEIHSITKPSLLFLSFSVQTLWSRWLRALALSPVWTWSSPPSHLEYLRLFTTCRKTWTRSQQKYDVSVVHSNCIYLHYLIIYKKLQLFRLLIEWIPRSKIIEEYVKSYRS